MHWIDHGIIAVYFLGMMGVGVYFLLKQGNIDAYFVGSRKMSSGHISLSIVATDVGGGFSIGLGGLGFAMGISGSWLLFSGLIGAWLSAVILIPRVKSLGDKLGWMTFPQYLEHRYDGRTRAVAAVVSGVAYAAFVGSQILAGATIATEAFGVDQTTAALGMAVVVVGYTTFGGLEAVVYTDTIQWAVLLGGLLFLGVPFAWMEVGGWEVLQSELPKGHLSFTNLSLGKFLTWMLTIVPIWFVGNTLYQRIYASRDLESARRAWYMAGLLEWPLLAFLGTLLGVFARVLFPELDPETESEHALPMLLKGVLPIGVTGVMMAVYLSAIMSTADSCLLASVGHFISDVYTRYVKPDAEDVDVLRLSRFLTFFIGALSITVALFVPTVIDAIMLAYSFMVSGLFAPLLLGLLWKKPSAPAALGSILVGGGLAIVLNALIMLELVDLGTVDPVLIALPASFVALAILSVVFPRTEAATEDDVPDDVEDPAGGDADGPS